MAQIPWGIAMAVKIQAVAGTPETFATAASLVIADGIVLGDASAGIGLSGIDMEVERIDKAIAPVATSFTQQFPSFLRRQPSKLSIAIPAKGHCANVTGTPADADFNPIGATSTPNPGYTGLDALLRSAGLTGSAWGGGIGWSYVPASAQIITVKVWVGSGSNTVLYVFSDVISNLTMDYTPGDSGVWTFDMAGILASVTSGVTFPTSFAFLHVATQSAPTVQQANNSFGLTGGMTARGFSACSITLDNGQEDVPDSNAAGGTSKRQTGRTVGMALTLFADDVTEGYEDTLLAATVAPTDDVTFSVLFNNAITQASQPQLGHRINFNNPNVKKQAPDKLGPSVARVLELEATATAANAEFELVLL